MQSKKTMEIKQKPESCDDMRNDKNQTALSLAYNMYKSFAIGYVKLKIRHIRNGK